MSAVECGVPSVVFIFALVGYNWYEGVRSMWYDWEWWWDWCGFVCGERSEGGATLGGSPDSLEDEDAAVDEKEEGEEGGDVAENKTDCALI
jgi:hypothetical protein